VRGQPVVDVPGAANPIELRSCHLGSAVAELALMEPSESGRASARVFLAFALLAGFAFFIAFFLRDAPPRFAFLDFFATFNLPNRINQNYATALAEATTSNWRTPCVNHSSM